MSSKSSRSSRTSKLSKELTKLTIRDLFEGFNKDFWSCWEEDDDGAVKAFRKSLSEETLEAESDILICRRPHEMREKKSE